MATVIGFTIMAFIGLFVKFIHIPVNNITVGGSVLINQAPWRVHDANAFAVIKPDNYLLYYHMDVSGHHTDTGRRSETCQLNICALWDNQK